MNLTERTQFFETSGTYHAVDLREAFMDCVAAGDGVVRPYDALVVPKSGTVANPDAGGGARNMSVDVLGSDAGGPAVVWVLGDTTPGTEGSYRQPLASSRYNLVIGSNASGSVRIDNVNLRIDTSGQQGVLEIQAGTPAAGAPTPPASTVCLAQVTVASGATSIIGSNVLDVRPSIRRTSYFAYMADTTGDTASPAFRLPQSAWTNVDSLLVSFTLPRDQNVIISAQLQANADATSGATGQVYLDVTDNNTSLLMQVGPVDVATNGAFGSRQAISLPARVVTLAAGAHTIRLQAGRDASGTVNAMNPATVNGRAVRRTWLQVIV